MNIRDWYERVNSTWANEVPPLTAAEAVKAAPRLLKKFSTIRPVKEVKVTSGNRYTWVRRGILYVNPDRKETIGGGWAALVHDLSHYVHWHDGVGKPHSKEHAKLEIKMVKYVVRSGWLDGKLKP